MEQTLASVCQAREPLLRVARLFRTRHHPCTQSRHNDDRRANESHLTWCIPHRKSQRNHQHLENPLVLTIRLTWMFVAIVE